MITNNNIQKIEGMTEWLEAVPYDVTRNSLYAAADLYGECDEGASLAKCYDSRVYEHYLKMGKNARDVRESLARTLHDHGIHMALDAFFEEHDSRLCVGIMGGHALQRSDPMFANIVLLSKRLTEEGFFMLSGGGPGAMEATHLGAWMAGRTQEETIETVRYLAAAAESFNDKAWLKSALDVMHRYPQQQYVSLGIPTWLYGLPSFSRTASAKTASSRWPTVASSIPPAAPVPCRKYSRMPCKTITSRSASPVRWYSLAIATGPRRCPYTRFFSILWGRGNTRTCC